MTAAMVNHHFNGRVLVADRALLPCAGTNDGPTTKEGFLLMAKSTASSTYVPAWPVLMLPSRTVHAQLTTKRLFIEAIARVTAEQEEGEKPGEIRNSYPGPFAFQVIIQTEKRNSQITK
ncbi:hypothetical protein OS493_040370, partial [Desmophyllum pertusum]